MQGSNSFHWLKPSSLGENFLQPDLSGFNNHNAYSSKNTHLEDHVIHSILLWLRYPIANRQTNDRHLSLMLHLGGAYSDSSQPSLCKFQELLQVSLYNLFSVFVQHNVRPLICHLNWFSPENGIEQTKTCLLTYNIEIQMQQFRFVDYWGIPSQYLGTLQ